MSVYSVEITKDIREYQIHPGEGPGSLLHPHSLIIRSGQYAHAHPELPARPYFVELEVENLAQYGAIRNLFEDFPNHYLEKITINRSDDGRGPYCIEYKIKASEFSSKLHENFLQELLEKLRTHNLITEKDQIAILEHEKKHALPDIEAVASTWKLR